MFRGSLVALVTPMKADASLDWDALEKLVEWHIAEGSNGLVAMGTTGESATLSVVEHMDVVRHVVKQVAGRIPVIAGTGANSTSEALELTRSAQDAGVDGALLVTPYYNKPTQEGLFLHHQYIAERVALPQLLYNVPGRTAVDMLPETVARLALVDNIVGIKDATGDVSRLIETKALVADDFLFLSGDDETSCEFLHSGGHGVISVTANVVPKLMAKMCELVRQDKVEDAKAIDAGLLDLHKNLFLESNPIPVKWVVSQLGFGTDTLRLPLTTLAEPHQDILRDILVKHSLLS